MRNSNIKNTKEKKFDMEIYNPAKFHYNYRPFFSRIHVYRIQIHRETVVFFGAYTYINI